MTNSVASGILSLKMPLGENCEPGRALLASQSTSALPGPCALYVICQKLATAISCWVPGANRLTAGFSPHTKTGRLTSTFIFSSEKLFQFDCHGHGLAAAQAQACQAALQPARFES